MGAPRTNPWFSFTCCSEHKALSKLLKNCCEATVLLMSAIEAKMQVGAQGCSAKDRDLVSSLCADKRLLMRNGRALIALLKVGGLLSRIDDDAL